MDFVYIMSEGKGIKKQSVRQPSVLRMTKAGLASGLGERASSFGIGQCRINLYATRNKPPLPTSVWVAESMKRQPNPEKATASVGSLAWLKWFKVVYLWMFVFVVEPSCGEGSLYCKIYFLAVIFLNQQRGLVWLSAELLYISLRVYLLIRTSASF